MNTTLPFCFPRPDAPRRCHRTARACRIVCGRLRHSPPLVPGLLVLLVPQGGLLLLLLQPALLLLQGLVVDRPGRRSLRTLLHPTQPALQLRSLCPHSLQAHEPRSRFRHTQEPIEETNWQEKGGGGRKRQGGCEPPGA